MLSLIKCIGQCTYSMPIRLFEDAARVEGLVLATEVAFPSEEVLNELLISGVVNISLAPVVVLSVDSVPHLSGDLLATDKEAACNLELGLLTEDDDRTKTVLAEALQALNVATS